MPDKQGRKVSFRWLRTLGEYLGVVEEEGRQSRCGDCLTVIWWGRDAYAPHEWICPLCAVTNRERMA